VFYYSRNVFSQGRAAGYGGRRFESCRLACARPPIRKVGGFFYKVEYIIRSFSMFPTPGESVGHPTGN
jgi:hypothetical protein